MKRLLDSLEGGSVQLQNKKKMTVYAILITLAAIVLALSILLISSVVLAVKNNRDPQGNGDTTGDGIPAGFVTTSGLAADKTHLLLLDDNHPYNGTAPAVILMKNSENRAYYMLEDNKKYAYTIGGTETLSGTVESLTALNQMLQAFYDACKDDNLYIANAYNPSATNQSVIYATGETYELDCYSDYENDPGKKDSIYGKSTYTWIYNNAYKYGFVPLFPAEGSGEESNTENANIFRYVGIPHATYMESKSLSLTEYLEYLKSRSATRPVSLADGHKAYYIAGDATQIIPDSERYTYTVSGDNMGGYVVTYKKK